MKPNSDALISADDIAGRIRAMGAEISRDLAGQDVVIVAVLKGAIFFASDILRVIDIPVSLDFIRPKSYSGTQSTNQVDILFAPAEPLTNRTILLVEDIIDTGRTASIVLDWLAQRRPASVRIATLLDKPVRRNHDVRPDYVGFEIDNHFVVGYGLDYEEKYRELPGIHILDGSEG